MFEVVFYSVLLLLPSVITQQMHSTSYQNACLPSDIKKGGWQNKLGYVAQHANASMTLRMENIAGRVKKLTLHSLQSYGPKWANSTARFTLKWNHSQSGEKYETFFDVLGYHNQNTSIAKPFILDLGPDHIAQKGSTVDLHVDLIGGTTFKINALMICSR